MKYQVLEIFHHIRTSSTNKPRGCVFCINAVSVCNSMNETKRDKIVTWGLKLIGETFDKMEWRVLYFCYGPKSLEALISCLNYSLEQQIKET